MTLGLLLMRVIGLRGVVLVCVANLLGLSLSHAAGRSLPAHGAPPASQGGDSLPQPTSDATRSAQTVATCLRLGRWVPIQLITWLAAHRYLALAIGFYLRGTGVIGSGGGMALLACMGRQYRYWRFLFTIAAAISPLPTLKLVGPFATDLRFSCLSNSEWVEQSAFF